MHDASDSAPARIVHRRVRTAGATGGSPVYAARRGMALVVALVLLLAMSLVAVTTLKGTRLNERAASNMQQKAISFHALDSAVERVWSVDVLRPRLGAATPDGDAEAVPIPSGTTGLSDDYDLLGASGGIDIDGSVSVRFCGEAGAVDGGLDVDESGHGLVMLVFDVTGEASVEGSGARTVITRRGLLAGPRTGRRGDCPAPE